MQQNDDDLTFADLGVIAPIVKRLEDRGITKPFEIQTLVMPDALKGQDILGKAKTGSGKTLAFAIPIAQRLKVGQHGTQALVLVPTRELCSQVAEELGSMTHPKTRVLAAYGGTGLRQHIQEASKADVIVATPGRLIDLLERKAADLGNVHMLVIDEADRMADMGFLPQVGIILRHVPRDRQTMLFSATLDHAIIGLMAQTRDPVRHEVTDRLPTVESVEHHFFEVHLMDKLQVLIALLEHAPGPTLVFTRTKRACDRIAKQLRSEAINATPIHGDLSQSDRERALSRFEKGEVAVLVATDVAARGLDVEGIAQVVNYDPPDDHKNYLHRVGRTARAGRSGVGITLATWEQRTEVERIARQLKLHPEVVEIVSTDPRLRKVSSGELVGAQPMSERDERSAASGAYAKLARTRRRRR